MARATFGWSPLKEPSFVRNQADREMERRAASQHGVVHRKELLALGHSDRSIDYRIRSGRLLPLYPGAYVLAGVPLSWHGRLMGAVRWTQGWASHRAAATLFDLPGRGEAPIEVTTHRHDVTPHSGTIIHRTLRLPADQVTRRLNIPVTSIERTLLDLGSVWRERQVAIAMDDALHRGLTTVGDIDHCLYRTARRGRRGCAVLRRLMHKRLQLDEYPNSPLETMVFELISDSHLPDPEPQVSVFGRDGRFIARPDFAYGEFRVAVEAHSAKWHKREFAFERDAGRHEELVTAGWRVIYVTYRDVVDRPDETIARIEAALRERGWTGATEFGGMSPKNVGPARS